MKILLKYSLTSIFLTFVYASLATVVANVGGRKGKVQEVQLHQQQADYAEPDSEVVEEFSEAPSGVDEIVPDSVIDDSVSKYNFILYFLYKLKYEEEDI